MLPAPLKFLNLSRMKERSQNLIRQKGKDDATMNFVSRQAPEAILDPNLPESYKDDIVGAAVGTVLRITERRRTYNAGQREERRVTSSNTIYQAK